MKFIDKKKKSQWILSTRFEGAAIGTFPVPKLPELIQWLSYSLYKVNLFSGPLTSHEFWTLKLISAVYPVEIKAVSLETSFKSHSFRNINQAVVPFLEFAVSENS